MCTKYDLHVERGNQKYKFTSDERNRIHELVVVIVVNVCIVSGGGGAIRKDGRNVGKFICVCSFCLYLHFGLHAIDLYRFVPDVSYCSCARRIILCVCVLRCVRRHFGGKMIEAKTNDSKMSTKKMDSVER